ncbi:MAG: LPS assembly protein LptD, partial [Planctomycetia bacterium]|nr:LPS assembly protein LptD [Planctomycetia bacterium]
AGTGGALVVTEQPLHVAEGAELYPHVLSTQNEIRPGDVSSFDPNTAPPGTPKISFFQRNDVPLEMRFSHDPETNRSVAIFDKGVMLLIDGTEQVLAGMEQPEMMKSFQTGTIDISADRLVIWSNADLSRIQADKSLDLTRDQVELYMEGNIIFRQGDQEIYAERMYFDVSTRRGLIREAEVFATVPNVEGLLRLRAEEIRMPEEGVLMANNTFVTTSRIGEPVYRFEMGQLVLRDQKEPRMNHFTGEAMIDPDTGAPIMDSRKELVARQTKVKVGNLPVFYLPYFAAPMDSPSQIINKFSIRKDSIFGFQPMIGVDAYRLFGMERPWKGTDWDINAFYYTKRGPGLGTEFSYNRTGEGMEIPLGLFSGKGYGEFEFWGIYDTGKDNLGEGRRHLEPEKEFRYQIVGRHRNTFGNDWELRFQLGVMSDRNFQEEYFQNSWYREPDRATQVEIRKSEENRTFSLWADVRTNDFHTQTQRLPQLDFYWLGQPLLNDTLTWSSYSEAGYVHLFPDTAPKDPADRELWHLLDWEYERKGVRTSTRHEIAYPFQAGAVKLVPFALGEVAYWGEDIQGDDTSRVYGQAGLRASLPMWQYYDFHNRLMNVNGVMHKVEFDMEAIVAGANKDVEEFPLYDLPDDRALLDFSHHMSSTIFGGLPIPAKYQLRSYAIRSNIGGWVTSSTELADDLAMIRFGMHHRWQTKRGMPGREKIVDWITFDTNFNIYPDPDRDNFGSVIGLLDYDLRWYPGDRVMIYSSGLFDFFDDGINMVDIGAVLDRPGKGSVFASLHYLTGSVDNVVMRLGYNYRMSEKWTSTFVSTFDISGKGNIGEGLSLTRIGESFLFTTGFAYDAPSDNFSVHFALEPRFGKKGNTARLFNIAPPGVNGID